VKLVCSEAAPQLAQLFETSWRGLRTDEQTCSSIHSVSLEGCPTINFETVLRIFTKLSANVTHAQNF
jgi:hypothetical protein